MTIKKLVLIGAGPANLYALTAFKALPRADTDVHFVTPYDTVVSPRMVCGLVAGHYSVGDCSIHLPTLLGQSAIKSHFSVCTGLDTRTQQVHLQHGAPLHYDVLSLDTSPVMDRELMDTRIAGAKEHALFVQPLAQFAKLWPQVLAHAQQHALNISVIGASPVGVEMALALQHQLPHCRVTLLAQSEKPEANTNPVLPQKIIGILKSRRITVLHDSCKALQAQSMLLNSGASLSCDMALIASGEHPPAWLSHCDLALDAQGHALVNSFAQATSYPQVFSMSGFGWDATNTAGRVLDRNLRAALDHQPLKSLPNALRSVNLMGCGDRTAIATWGAFTLKGRWAWQLKHVMDQRWIRQYKL